MEGNAPRSPGGVLESGGLRDGGGASPVRLYRERWLMLALLSSLALLSDWICFSVAPIPAVTEATYGLHPSSLVTLFLTTNVFFCLVEPYVVLRKGLGFTVVSGAVLMFLGCLMRSGLPQLPTESRALVEVGTVLVGAAQPFFQCTPAMLAANWFGANERTLATTIAINANQIGIAMSYLTGTIWAKSPEGLQSYFMLLTAIAGTLLVATALLFRSEPPTPASASSEGKAQQQSSSLLVQMRRMVSTPGFDQALVAFAVSIGITNVISTFLDHMLSHIGFSQHVIGIIGAGFQFCIMAGSLILGHYVDVSKRYFNATMLCFLVSFLCLIATSDELLSSSVLVLAILLSGFFVGPIQPITAEIAVEVTYPSDENAIVAIQQVAGNLFSAFLVPLCNLVRHYHVVELHTRSDHLLLLVICSAGGAYFSTFDAPLKRLMTEKASAHRDKGLDLARGFG